MAKKTLRLGLIGCGDNMRRSHVPRVRADGAVQVVAVADPRRSAAERVMAELGADAAFHEDWRRLIAGHVLDAVVISTPHDTHYAQVRSALRAGLHVLVEKPLAVSARHSRELLGLADGTGSMLVVSYQRHHMAAYAYARELIASGRLGEVTGVVGYVTQAPDARKEWRRDPVAAGGGMFADTGSHLVAAAMWVTGLRPRSVSAVVSRAGEPVDVDTFVQIRFDGGAVGSLTTLGRAGRHDERLAIAGTGGSLVLHMHQWRFRSLLVDDEPVRIPQRVRDGTPDASFFGWIRNHGRGYVPPLSAHRAVQITEAVYRSAERMRPVPIR